MFSLKKLKKLISVSLSLIILETSIGFSAPASELPIQIPSLFDSLPLSIQKKLPADFASFLESESFAVAQWSAVPPASKLPSRWVLHLSDIHADENYQRELALFLKRISNRVKISAIVFEGQEGDLGLQPYPSSPSPDLVKSVAVNLLKEKKISGGGFAAFDLAGKGIRFVGGESEPLYQMHVDALRKIFKSDLSQTLIRQRTNRNILGKLKKQYWNSNLRALDRFVAGSAQPSMSEWISVLDSQPGFEPALEILKLNLTGRPQLSSISSSADPNKTLLKLQQALNLRAALNPAQIIRSMEESAAAMFLSFSRSDFERQIYSLDRIHKLQTQLAELTLTPAQWDEYQTLTADLESSETLFEPLSRSLQIVDRELIWNRVFYQRSVDRNGSLAKTIKTELARDPSGLVICVTGGFHAPGLSAEMTQSNIGFLSLLPHSAETAESAAGLTSLRRFKENLDPLARILEEASTSALSSPALPVSAHITQGVAAVGVGASKTDLKLEKWGRDLLARHGGQVTSIEMESKPGSKKSKAFINTEFRGCYIRFDLGLFDFGVKIYRSIFKNNRNAEDASESFVEFEGIGLHTARPVRMRVIRKSPGHGIQVRSIDPEHVGHMDRTNSKRDEELRTIPVNLKTVVADTRRFSGLTNGPITIITPEHVLSALSAVGLWDVLIELDGPEFPFGNGTSGYFLGKLMQLQNLETMRNAQQRPALPIPMPVSFFRNANTFLMALPGLDPKAKSRYLSVVTLPGLLSIPGLRVWGQFEDKDLPHYHTSLAVFPTFIEKSLEELQRVERLFLGAQPGFNILLTWRHSHWPKLNPPAHKIMDAKGDLARLEADMGGLLRGNFFLGGVGHRDVLNLTQKISAVFNGERFPFQFHHAMDLLTKLNRRTLMNREAMDVVKTWLEPHRNADEAFNFPVADVPPGLQGNLVELLHRIFPAEIRSAVSAEINYPANLIHSHVRAYLSLEDGRVLWTNLKLAGWKKSTFDAKSMAVSVVDATETEIHLRVVFTFDGLPIEDSLVLALVLSRPGTSLTVEQFQTEKIYFQKAFETSLVRATWAGPFRSIGEEEGKKVGVYSLPWNPNLGHHFVPLAGPLSATSPKKPVTWALLGGESRPKMRMMAYATGRALTAGYLRMYQPKGIKPLGADGWAISKINWNSDVYIKNGAARFSHVRDVSLKSIPQFLFYLTHLSHTVTLKGVEESRIQRDWYPFGRYEDTVAVLMGMEDEIFETYLDSVGPEKALEEVRNWYTRYFRVMQDPLKSDLRDSRDMLGRAWLYSERHFDSDFDFVGKLQKNSAHGAPILKIVEERMIEMLSRINQVRGVQKSIDLFEGRFRTIFKDQSLPKLLEWYSNPPATSELAAKFFGESQIFGEHSSLFLDWLDLTRLNQHISKKIVGQKSSAVNLLEVRKNEILKSLHVEPSQTSLATSLKQMIQRLGRVAMVGFGLFWAGTSHAWNGPLADQAYSVAPDLSVPAAPSNRRYQDEV